MILTNRKLVERLARWIWLTIPLEYYIATQAAGPPQDNQYLSMATTSVLCVFFAFLMITAVSLTPFPVGQSAQSRIQARVIPLVCTWASAVTLISASYFFAGHNDLFPAQLCSAISQILTCGNYPTLMNPFAILEYATFSLVAAFIVGIAVQIAYGKTTNVERVKGPNIFTLAIPGALILDVSHGLAALL
jgi:hypothetical protein